MDLAAQDRTELVDLWNMAMERWDP